MHYPLYTRDTRQFRRAAATRRAITRLAVFALFIALSVFAVGYALSIAPTMRPLTVAEAAQ